MNDEPMTAQEASECLRIIGWTPSHLIARLGSHRATIQQMLRGTRAIPPNLATFLRTWRAFSEEHDRPPNWGKTNAERRAEAGENYKFSQPISG